MRGAWGVALLMLSTGCLLEGAPAAETASGEAVARVGYFTPEMTLVPSVPATPGAVGSGSFFQAWAEGVDFPTWLDDPQAVDRVVDAASVDLFVEVTGPVTRTARFPDIMVYAGSGDAWMGFVSTTTDPVLLPGTVYAFTLDLALPKGGLWLPAGEPFGIKVVPVMTQDDTRDVRVLVGGDDASRAEWTERVAAAPAVELAKGNAQGELVGSAYAGDAAPESVSHATALRFASAPTLVLAWMNTTSHDGIPDIDLALLGPDGATLASSGTPTPREGLRLFAPNLQGAGEYQLVVTSYGSARASFALEWLAG